MSIMGRDGRVDSANREESLDSGSRQTVLVGRPIQCAWRCRRANRYTRAPAGN